MTIARPTNDAEVIEMGKRRRRHHHARLGPLSRRKSSRSSSEPKSSAAPASASIAWISRPPRSHGLIICNAAGCNSIEVSEQAIGLLIAISRKLMRMNQYVRDGKWRRHTAELHAYRGRVYRIQGCTMGIVGLGHVGKQVAPRAQGMRLNVQTYDPYLDPEDRGKDGRQDGFVR